MLNLRVTVTYHLQRSIFFPSTCAGPTQPYPPRSSSPFSTAHGLPPPSHLDLEPWPPFCSRGRSAKARGPPPRHAPAAAPPRPGSTPRLRCPPPPLSLPTSRCIFSVACRSGLTHWALPRSRRRRSGRWSSEARSRRRRPTASPRGQIASPHPPIPAPLLLAELSCSCVVL
jgi:hypothetical protein